MYSEKSIKIFSLIIATYILIQSAVWFLASLFFALLYENVFTLDFDYGSIPSYIFEIVVSEDWNRSIIIFILIYLVLSIILCLFSALVLNSFVARSEKKIHKIFVAWSSILITLSIVDIVFTSFLGKDLSDMLHYATEEFPVPDNLTIAYSILILCGIRGMILWILNIICAGYILLFAFQLSNNNLQFRQNSNHYISAYEDSSGEWKHTNLNPLAAKENRKRSYNSLFHQNENLSINTEIFDKPTQSNVTTTTVDIDHPENYAERLANIGKPGKRNKSPSPINVPPPKLPNINEKSQGFDEEMMISRVFSSIDNMKFDEELRDENSPNIPAPDYSPLNSPLTRRTKF